MIKKMTDNPAINEVVLLVKHSLPTLVAVGATLFGAFAHAIETVRNAGWKGWAAFLSDVFVCSFVGWVFFHVLTLWGAADYSIIGSSIGSYWGTKGFIKIRDLFLDSVIKLRNSR
jgi:hypothetical protein